MNKLLNITDITYTDNLFVKDFETGKEIKSELADNYIINNLKKELREKEKAINSILQAIEQGIITKTTKERLLALEEEKEDIEAKIVYEECLTLKPLEKDKIKKFLTIYANEEFKSKRDKNDFFNNFISMVTLYDNGIEIEYNTGVEREEKTYNRPEENPVIYSGNIALSDEKNKKLPFVFKRQSDGWGGETWTPAMSESESDALPLGDTPLPKYFNSIS